ncbi:protein Tube [Drosophila innubila]|uniref:protein Tube n=1 Tax=Drosophila innubila TaxID=198719 RepID=UPI00148BEB66|nr:protein Tube [Drosophila innubila]
MEKAKTNGYAASSSVPRFSKYTRYTELRRVDDNDIYKLATLLDLQDCWKKLMQIIPKKLDAEACSSGDRNLKEIAGMVGYKYNNGHMRQIAEQQLMPGQSKSQIMIDEWKTSGKSNERPTVGVLLQLLIQAEIYSAADHVAEKFLNEARPARPAVGPAAPIKFDMDSAEIVEQSERMEVEDNGSFQPNTSELNAGAAGTSKMNMDFYEKHPVRRDKSMPHQLENGGAAKPVPPPRTGRSARLSKSTTNNETASTTNSMATTPDLPMLSIFNPSSDKLTTSTDQIQPEDVPQLSLLNGRSESTQTTSPNTGRTNGSNGSHVATNIRDMPLITLLMESSSCEISSTTEVTASASATSTSTSTTTSTNSTATEAMIMRENNATSCNNLPIISALYLNSAIEAASNGVAAVPHDDNSSGTNSLSNDDVDVDVDDEEADVSLPNLSNSDHQTSNNDSSLTTVTGTSGENSFELTNDSSLASNDEDINNIPDLSELQQ